MKEQTCCFTGHRTIADLEKAELEKRLTSELEGLIEGGMRYFACGGAIGFDTLAAETVIRLRERYRDIRLILVLPCIDQPKLWSEGQREKYFEILSRADKVTYTSESYSAGCMHKRNRCLADNSSVCVAYKRREAGGTAYTVKYALEKGLRVILL